MKKRLSIIDIAQQVGVSTTTVSFILNGKAKEKRISDRLTKKVLDLVEEVEYKPNHLAQSLRTGKTNIICLIVEDISNQFFASVARHIEEKAYKKGYKIVYCSTDNDVTKTRDLIRIFSQRQVDGYIITAPEGIETDLQELIDNHTPMVLFDRNIENVDSDYVVIDNFQSTKDAICHLIGNGYRNVAFLTVNSEQNQMSHRLAGYKAAMVEHGLLQRIGRVSYDFATMTAEIGNYLKTNPAVDAVFFATNYLGIHGLEAIQNLGLKIPEDVAVVSFDDHDIFRIYQPPVTAVSQPIEEISENLITVLLHKLEGKHTDLTTEKIMLPAKLEVRRSSMPSLQKH